MLRSQWCHCLNQIFHFHLPRPWFVIVNVKSFCKDIRWNWLDISWNRYLILWEPHLGRRCEYFPFLDLIITDSKSNLILHVSALLLYHTAKVYLRQQNWIKVCIRGFTHRFSSILYQQKMVPMVLRLKICLFMINLPM